MLENLNIIGTRVLILIALFVGAVDVFIFAARCPLSPPIGPWGVMIGFGIQYVAFLATASALGENPVTAKNQRSSQHTGKAVLFCVAAFLVSFGIIQKSVLYSDTWGKGRGARSIGDSCCVLCV